MALAAALLLAATGCATAPATTDGARAGEPVGRDASRPASVAERAIVRDLSDALAQALEPAATTLQVNLGADDALTATYVDELVARGFGIQRVPADQGPHHLVHEAVTLESSGGSAWRLAAGEVEVSRDYRTVGDDRVSAVSPMRVAGSRASVAVGAAGVVRVVAASPLMDRVEYVGPAPLERPAPIISLVTPEVVEGLAEAAAGGPGGALPSRRALNADRVEVDNLFFGGDAFESLEDSHERVGRQVVVFGDDSMVLGPDNRALLERFVDERMGPEDVVGLVGCSNGPTALEIGNEGLALGRAARVVEALVERGVARERVHDRGCWAPVGAGDRFPARAVVLELWRRVG